MSLKELFKREYARELDSYEPEPYSALEGALDGLTREEIETIFQAKATAREYAKKTLGYLKGKADPLADSWAFEMEKRRKRRILARMLDDGAPKIFIKELAEAIECE